MCEFKVILGGKAVFKDAVCAKTEDNSIVVRDLPGESEEFKNCKIAEADANDTRLIL